MLGGKRESEDPENTIYVHRDSNNAVWCRNMEVEQIDSMEVGSGEFPVFQGIIMVPDEKEMGVKES